MLMRTANPALNASVFNDVRSTSAETMTIQGTVNKSFILLIILLMTSSWTWKLYFEQGASSIGALMIVGIIGSIIAALVTIFKKTAAPISAPIYAAFEGLMLGGISSMAELRYPGIVMQAVGLTFGTLFCLLGAYRSGLIKATENFKLGIIAATGGIAVFYFVTFILSMFGFRLNAIFGNGLLGIGFSLVVVTIAALNLVLDFDFIESGADANAPKYMEWYGAFGLMVTLCWLYIEILRLLMKLRSRD